MLIFGGGEIAEKGILPMVGGTITNANVLDRGEVRRAVEINRPGVVVNCAGISYPAMIGEDDPEIWAGEIMVNLVGSYHVARAAVECSVPTMVFLASVAGLYGKPNHSGYCASKAGVISLVRSLAMEGHDAYAVSPGRVDTSMRERDFPGEDPRTRLNPLRIGAVIECILAGKYQAGDNIIVRKIGYEEHVRVDEGAPWRSWLRVGEPARY